MDKKDVLIKKREWEKQRDRCIAIRCPRVAAKYQRWIDDANKEIEKEKRFENGDKMQNGNKENRN